MSGYHFFFFLKRFTGILMKHRADLGKRTKTLFKRTFAFRPHRVWALQRPQKPHSAHARADSSATGLP